MITTCISQAQQQQQTCNVHARRTSDPFDPAVYVIPQKGAALSEGRALSYAPRMTTDRPYSKDIRSSHAAREVALGRISITATEMK